MSSPLIIIPSRMASTRLPGKPLADIHGLPMIAHVMKRAQQSSAGPVWVACSEEEVKSAVETHGGQACMTPPELPSGTDRVRYAADIIDPGKQHSIIVNVQGDMPALSPDLISKTVDILNTHQEAQIATAVVETHSEREKSDPNVVKAVLAQNGKALYFTRAHAPHGSGPVWHHVGIYAYRRDALDRFCSLPPSQLEVRERLEQLRALEADMPIYAAAIDNAPDGVDTPEDLERAREILKP
jgi:3-deoxy-manno-octulosonate cytidylyltransferase (CMP-KDO synthetase)